MSTKAEVRGTLESNVDSEGQVKLGSLLAAMGRQAEPTDREFAVFEQVRDKTPAFSASLAFHRDRPRHRPTQAVRTIIGPEQP